MSRMLSFNEFIATRSNESLDPYLTATRKFKVGQTVRLGKKIGKIVTIRGEKYTVLFGSDQRVCTEKELRAVDATYDPEVRPSRKKEPVEKSMGISENVLIEVNMPELDAYLTLLLDQTNQPRHKDVFEEYVESRKGKISYADLVKQITDLKLDPSRRKDSKIKNMELITKILQLVVRQCRKYPDVLPAELEERGHSTSSLEMSAVDYLVGEDGSIVTGFMGFREPSIT